MAASPDRSTDEVYASACCGALFMPPFGPDNIVEDPASDQHDAKRAGSCPACGEAFPALHEVMV